MQRPAGLCNLVDGGKPLVHNPPKRPYSFGFAVKKVFKETRYIEGGRICVPLTIFPEFGKPIARFLGVDHPEKSRMVKVRLPDVVQNPKVIGLDTNYDIWLTGTQIVIPCVLSPQFD